MDHETRLSLRTFALAVLAAEKYQRARHQCRVPACPACGPAPLEVVVETHTGSARGNFRGVVHGRCSRCAGAVRVFSFTGSHRQPTNRKALSCSCGDGAFWLMICERIEGEDGLPGFFDEGVVAGRCAACGRERIVVAYD